jgi:hypothetical protein
MGKFVSILIGLVLMGLGIWGIVTWPTEVLGFLKAVVVIMALLVGLGIFVFALSELRPEEAVRAPASPTPPITDNPEREA